MTDILTRGMTKELKVVFVTADNVIFDPVNATVRIVHYDNNFNEIVDLPDTPLTKISDGNYLHYWTVPNTFPENATAFVYYHGDNGIDVILFQENIRIAPVGFYAPPSNSGMVVKFTKD